MNKMFLTRLVAICISYFLLVSCSPKLTNPLQFEGASIAFGEGGGFAGIENRYVILDNGQLFEQNRQDGSYSKLKGANKNKIIQVFETYQMLNFTALELNDPGNLYYFLEFQSKADQKHRMVWGNGDVDQNVELVYKILLREVKESKE